MCVLGVIQSEKEKCECYIIGEIDIIVNGVVEVVEGEVARKDEKETQLGNFDTDNASYVPYTIH